MLPAPLDAAREGEGGNSPGPLRPPRRVGKRQPRPARRFLSPLPRRTAGRSGSIRWQLCSAGRGPRRRGSALTRGARADPSRPAGLTPPWPASASTTPSCPESKKVGVTLRGGRGAGVCRGEKPSPGWGELDGTWRLGGNLGEGKGETLLFQNKYYYLNFLGCGGGSRRSPWSGG